MSKLPFRYDIVGSFLRPAVLLKAREDFRNGKIDEQKLQVIEREEIKKLVDKEAKAGLKAVTDGEFTRSWFAEDWIVGLNGMEKLQLEHGIKFHSVETTGEYHTVAGKIGYNPDHPFFALFEFLKSVTPEGHIPKVTIPAPALIFNYNPFAFTPDVYKGNKEEYLNDLVDAYKKSISRFYDLGCRYLQLDDTMWTYFAYFLKNARTDLEKSTILQVAKDDLYILNKILEGKPSDLWISMHSCRGNYKSDYAFEGAYDSIIDTLSKVNVDGLFLEYDDERSGGFEPLAKIHAESPTRRVILGLITSKFAKLESEDEVIARIHEAAKYIPLENLGLSTQCGFASCEEGNILTEEEQWAKVDLVIRIAKRVWGDA
ncbi:MAG: putative 5-methyltetrahydropteroyltriglutamate--homocysteine S-methyltransferase [Streblomastix strix]|uniref:Putative 5-methyltetrahydropteroyltriglutamate--homocysteine S-methyltransferase n=1 Tax=Streblomastix strix TaxID=222440 RepID=A0A5J4V3P9_9EUKA|nr:MAG: putative 5-methyltetrahydropteroyltriglutamate--homocysteine S-methyltransferase [Streblomastix strix]